ncbi:thioesterase family protein [Adhaeribacter terreus]|uniref:Thioesterase family protein n=1 Tax=Adhaeribacter terreus TaxID=529703 RepID=A0ABW0E7V3_9BACT
MKNLFRPGDIKTYQKTVSEADFAQFETGLVHPVCATFSLAQAVEWASRLFVLEMKDEDEEGIGTLLTIEHKSPAFAGETITITATVKSLERNELICSYEAKVGERLVATGETGQKILKKEKLQKILQKPSETDGQSER